MTMKRKPHTQHPPHRRSAPDTLRGVRPGALTRIAGFAADTAGDLRERLLAYGLIPGQTLRVLAQRPLTVVQIEHTELALEDILAACVEVEAAPDAAA
ncbi:MAG: ferrous iron transport protein A [Candidatus Accumulibacter sp.]|jgi:Fe2+ transport system protein FeoA|nr:ferrous iron transport protein A [Accumulibacter sp.]MBA4094370.1 ferrous iron transport protein A [Accumulibacter sp.]